MAPVCVRVAFIGGGQGEPSRWADRYSLRCACDTEAGIVANQNEKNCAEHTRGNDTMGAAPVPASPSPSTRDEVARSENLPEPYRGPSRAIVAPQARPPARPARENGGFPTPPQEKDRREE